MFESKGGCVDCLEPRKRYELDEHGRCNWCQRYARRTKPLPPPPFPTEHLPGTFGKLLVLEYRAANGFGLYHPLDAVEDPRGCGEVKHWPSKRDLDVYVYAAAM
jgi:hypothetical protein